MSAKQFSLNVNGTPAEIKSRETKLLLEIVTTVKDPTSDTLQWALDQKDDQDRPYRTFFLAGFQSRGSMDDEFQVTIVESDGGTIVGTATREQIVNRLTVAQNREAYVPTIVKTKPEGAAKNAPKASTKVAADEL